jgi:lysine 2,3-aminomutase
MLNKTTWGNEFSRAFKNSADLLHFLEWNDDLSAVDKVYPLFVPYRLAELMKQEGPQGILAREFLSHPDELDSLGYEDPIGDKNFNKAPQLIHRYPSRALFTPTTVCPVHCRYCFRKNELTQQEDLFKSDFDQTIVYLNEHPEISEIIFTGGDPLTVSNEKLDRYLEAFSRISSIKDIRFHSRFPVILPERLDDDFSLLIKKYSAVFRTISLAIHANHVQEFDALARENIQKLATLPLQLLSQTVLLKGVNDSVQSLLDLFNLFLDLKIRPYYLHHPDQVKGGMHFYLPLEDGRRLYAMLRGHLPGWAIPHYIFDIPHGHGKVSAFNPESYLFSGRLIGQNGKPIEITEPAP